MSSLYDKCASLERYASKFMRFYLLGFRCAQADLISCLHCGESGLDGRTSLEPEIFKDEEKKKGQTESETAGVYSGRK